MARFATCSHCGHLFQPRLESFIARRDSCNRQGIETYKDIADELRGPTIWYGAMGGAVRLLGRENNLMLLEYAGERISHIVAEHGDYRATEIAAELMAKLYAASEEPCLLPFSRSGIALQLCFSGRAMIKTQVVKLTTSTRRL